MLIPLNRHSQPRFNLSNASAHLRFIRQSGKIAMQKQRMLIRLNRHLQPRFDLSNASMHLRFIRQRGRIAMQKKRLTHARKKREGKNQKNLPRPLCRSEAEKSHESSQLGTQEIFRHNHSVSLHQFPFVVICIVT